MKQITLSFLVYMLPVVTGLKLFLEERCGKKLQMNEIGLNWLRLKPSKRLYYQPNMDCIVTIETENDKKLSVVFVSIDIEFEPWCGDDYLLMYDGNSTLSPLVDGLPHKICGETAPKGSYVTTSKFLTVRFKTDSYSNENGFNLVITSFHDGQCNRNEHKCKNGRCIYNSLVNDGINHCGDSSDEFDISREATWGIVGGVLILVIIGACLAVHKRRRKRMATMNEKGTNIEPVWQPEEIVPPEGRKRSDTLAGVPEPDLHIQTLYPGIMENGENITLDLHHSDSCGNACHVNMVFDESEEDLYLSTRTKNDRSLSSVW